MSSPGRAAAPEATAGRDGDDGSPPPASVALGPSLDDVAQIRSLLADWTEAVQSSDLYDRDSLARFALEVQGRSGDQSDSGLLGDVQMLRKAIVDRLVPMLDRNGTPEELTIREVGHFTVHGGGPKSTRYDNLRVLSAAASRLADSEFTEIDMETGEVVNRPPGVVAEAIVLKMAALSGCATASYAEWRKGAAKNIGINLKAYELASETNDRVPYSVVIR